MAGDGAPSISVVIRCFNEERHIGRLLTGLLKQSHRPQQIVIVDSGSSDATLAIAARFPVEVEHIAPDRFSFGRSLNIGCQAATGELIAIVSAHVYPLYDSWLRELSTSFADERVALAYGRQCADPASRYSERQILAQWFPATSDPDQQHPFCNNANALIRRSIWQQAPYDEALTGLEDMAWAKHALEAGHRLAYVASAPVAHVHDETWEQVVNRYRREAIAHRQIMRDHGMGRFDALRLGLASIASDYVHAARERQLARNLISIPWFRSAQFLGTYRGFAQRGEVSGVLRERFYYPAGLRRPKVTEEALAGDGGGALIKYEDAPTR